MSPADRVELIDVLGQGEVTATLEANGESTLRETSYAGIWWILHRDRDGAVTAELLEVTLAPQILAAAPDDIALASAALKRRIGVGDTAPAAAPGCA